MKKYESPVLEQLLMQDEDILTLSVISIGDGLKISYGDFSEQE